MVMTMMILIIITARKHDSMWLTSVAVWLFEGSVVGPGLVETWLQEAMSEDCGWRRENCFGGD